MFYNIEELNEWFSANEEYGLYHHTEEEDGEDLYMVGYYKMPEFCDYLRENEPDLVGIPCMVGADGIWFRSTDLEKARHL